MVNLQKEYSEFLENEDNCLGFEPSVCWYDAIHSGILGRFREFCIRNFHNFEGFIDNTLPSIIDDDIDDFLDVLSDHYNTIVEAIYYNGFDRITCSEFCKVWCIGMKNLKIDDSTNDDTLVVWRNFVLSYICQEDSN